MVDWFGDVRYSGGYLYGLPILSPAPSPYLRRHKEEVVPGCSICGSRIALPPGKMVCPLCERAQREAEQTAEEEAMDLERDYVYRSDTLEDIGYYRAGPTDLQQFRVFKGAHWTGVKRRADRLIARMGLGLASEEVGAITGYTSQDYQFINPMLRGRGRNSVPSLVRGMRITPSQLLPYINCTVSSLNKLALTNEVTYRGTNLPSNILRGYTKGAVVSNRAFLSTTVDKKIAYKPMSGKASLHRFTIHHRSGRDVTALTLHSNENEILFLPGTRFQVMARKSGRNRIIYFLLEEA